MDTPETDLFDLLRNFTPTDVDDFLAGREPACTGPRLLPCECGTIPSETSAWGIFINNLGHRRYDQSQLREDDTQEGETFYPPGAVLPCSECGMEPCAGASPPCNPATLPFSRLVQLGEQLAPDPLPPTYPSDATTQEVRAVVLGLRARGIEQFSTPEGVVEIDRGEPLGLWHTDDAVYEDPTCSVAEAYKRMAYTLADWKKNQGTTARPLPNGTVVVGELMAREVPTLSGWKKPTPEPTTLDRDETLGELRRKAA